MRYLLSACVLFLGCSSQQPAEHPAAVAFRQLAEHEAAKDYGYLWDHFSRAERTRQLKGAESVASTARMLDNMSDAEITDPKMRSMMQLARLKGRALWLKWHEISPEFSEGEFEPSESDKFTGREVVSVDEAGLLTLRVNRADGDLEEKARMIQEDGQWVYDGNGMANMLEKFLERSP